MKKTLYDLLGVPATATQAEIEAQYRGRLEELAQHSADPDVENQRKFIRHAFDTLSNPTLRARYDQRLATPAPVSVSPADDGLADEAPDRRWIWLLAGVSLVLLAWWGWHRSSNQPERRQAMPVQQPALAETPESAPPAILSSSELFEATSPSIVVVVGRNGDTQLSSLGSGVVIERGEVVTNCHVVAQTPDVKVLYQGKDYSARVRYQDHGHDLCQLSVSGLDAPAARLGGPLRVGNKVFALGAPQGLELSLSEGIVSSLRDFDKAKLIQTTAAISPGSSGGGLFDERGGLVGITTFQSRTGQNLNFAVPAEWIALLPQRDGNRDALLPGEEPQPRAQAPSTGGQVEVNENLYGYWDCTTTVGNDRRYGYEFSPGGMLVFSLGEGSGKRSRFNGSYRWVRSDALTLSVPQFDPPTITLQINELSSERLVLQLPGDERHTHSCTR
ncbi:trypsin-like peptidase domain-containing protein [Chitinolyticbacter meiyuanensis]|uniref:trypsin-like peptidase domain-containing protein n=1 Tax=Chitinolyticbacter meiyuanensis TaxID=682798 RepID=UPI0016528EEB|nr:trypsin-like peptidase domain-containing protein [Chitinolyticbacter meiyuanensis]